MASVKRWEFNHGAAWLYIDDKLMGSFTKTARLSVTFNRDGSLYYGCYEQDEDLEWIEKTYDLLYG